MSVVDGEWSTFNSLAKLDMVFSVKASGTELPVEVRQSFDKNPRILFLEEGSERIGLRVLFNLYDRNNIVHGHGMTETWLHPDGQMFVTAATMFENTAAHEAVTQANLDIDIPKGLANNDLGMVEMTNPCGHVMLTSSDPSGHVPELSLFWKTGRMEHNTYVYRSSFGMKGAPSYFRWPDYHRQAYTQRTLPDYINAEGERVAWPPGRGAFVDQIIPSENGIQLHWPSPPIVHFRHPCQPTSI